MVAERKFDRVFVCRRDKDLDLKSFIADRETRYEISREAGLRLNNAGEG